jgi:hypothetical protein
MKMGGRGSVAGRAAFCSWYEPEDIMLIRGNYIMPNDGEEQGGLDLQHHTYSLLLAGGLYTAPLEPLRSVPSMWAQGPRDRDLGRELRRQVS